MTAILQIGLRIKNRRQELGLTQKEVARKTGLSPAFLSQVEHGKVSLTINSLESVAMALDTHIVNLISDDAHASSAVQPSVEKLPEGKLAYDPVKTPLNRSRLLLPTSNMMFELLTPSINRKFVAYKHQLRSHTVYIASRLSEPTDQVIYVLSGKLGVGLESGDYELNPDDSIYYNDNDKLMRLVCLSEDEDVVFLVIISPPVY
ncbi:MAG: helix-turn-helix transcriptional regulator [Anaerolineae bacterium]|nr:helix-turn-helix transcriptional regulator [Anaerolineae bacterium]